MKKYLNLILCVIIALCLCACGFNKSGEDERQENDGRITVVYNDGWCIICRDNETGVQYFSRPNAGSCVMVNPDGTPYCGARMDKDTDEERATE